MSTSNLNKDHGHDTFSICSAYEWSNYYYQWFLMIALMRVNFMLNGKNPALCLYTRKEINSVWKITDPSPYCSFAAKYFNVSFITKCLGLLTKFITGFRPGDSCVNQLLANYQLPMKCISLLKTALKWRGFLRYVKSF